MTQETMVGMHRVLVTGAAGAVGTPACRALVSAGHFVRGLDLRPSKGCSESLIGSAGDAALLAEAMQGIDTVIHLAAEPNDCDFVSRLVPANFVAPWLVMEAARAAGVKRAVLASSIQAVGRFWKNRGMTRIADGVSPHSGYGLSKAFIEDLGLMFRLRHQMEVICARIGWLPRTAEDHAHAIGKASSVYLSHDDAGRFFTAAVECPKVDYVVAFVTSRPTQPDGQLDLTEARSIGFEPQDAAPDGCHFDD